VALYLVRCRGAHVEQKSLRVSSVWFPHGALSTSRWEGLMDAYDPSQDFPFARFGRSRVVERVSGQSQHLGTVVYRYRTAEDRARHLDEERKVLG